MMLNQFCYETHLHTAPVSACAFSSPEEQVRAYAKHGYAGIIVTDHFINGNCNHPRAASWRKKMDFFISGYERAKKEGKRRGLDVFFGWEYFIRGLDFLTYGFTPDFLYENPGIDTLDIAAYSRLVRENGGYLAQAHPFRKAAWIPSSQPVDAVFIDGVEVYNGGMYDHVNKSAYEFAQFHKLPMQSGTDSHSTDRPILGGIALAQKAESIHDIIAAIKSGQAQLIRPEN